MHKETEIIEKPSKNSTIREEPLNAFCTTLLSPGKCFLYGFTDNSRESFMSEVRLSALLILDSFSTNIAKHKVTNQLSVREF